MTLNGKLTQMHNDDTIIGYTRTGKDTYEPIYEPKRGFVYTQAFIICHECNTAISGCGGPRHNSLCLKCFDNYKLERFIDGQSPLART